MNDALIVTAYNRPKSLIRCLESIKACNLEGVDVLVSHDARGPKQDTLGFHCVEQLGCVEAGDNIRFALHSVQDRPLIMFVEDDFIVESGFVDWHRKVHRDFAPLISCADNSYTIKLDDPSGIMLSHSQSHVHAGCVTGATIRELLDKSWPTHFEGVIQNHLIKNKLLSVHALMPRAYDTGSAGANLPKRKTVFTLQNPPTPEVFKALVDYRWRWEKDYKAQEQWGF